MLKLIDLIQGPKAFWKSPTTSYIMNTKIQMAAKEPLPPIHCFDTESKTYRLAKKIISIILFPLFIFWQIHSYLCQKYYLPLKKAEDYQRNHGKAIEHLRYDLSQIEPPWRIKRLAIQVNGETVDAVILGKEQNFENGRWLIYAPGSGESYESILTGLGRGRTDIKKFADTLDANLLVFNYPGLGASRGAPSTTAFKNAYLGCLDLVEKGFNAKEIISHGYSLGGGVIGEAISQHKFYDDKKYVFIKDRTFDTTANAALYLKIPVIKRLFLFILSTFTRTSLDAKSSIEKSNVREFILQSSLAKEYHHIDRYNRSLIKDDGSIPKKGSLAWRLAPSLNAHQNIIGIPEMHHENFRNVEEISQIVLRGLNQEVV